MRLVIKTLKNVLLAIIIGFYIFTIINFSNCKTKEIGMKCKGKV